MSENRHYHHFDFGESWITKNWRPLAAIVYLLICMTDFVGMPIYYQWANHRYAPGDLVELALKLPPAAQIDGLKVLRMEDTWTPLTLTQNGMFHIAFGAILGVAAWSRGNDKQNQYAAAVMAVQTTNDQPKA